MDRDQLIIPKTDHTPNRDAPICLNKLCADKGIRHFLSKSDKNSPEQAIELIEKFRKKRKS